MNTKATNTVDTVVVIALSVFFYGCIPLFGLFKAYTTKRFVDLYLGYLAVHAKSDSVTHDCDH